METGRLVPVQDAWLVVAAGQEMRAPRALLAETQVIRLVRLVAMAAQVNPAASQGRLSITRLAAAVESMALMEVLQALGGLVGVEPVARQRIRRVLTAIRVRTALVPGVAVDPTARMLGAMRAERLRSEVTAVTV